MPIFIQKISSSGGQYRVTLPKDLIKELGFEKTRVVTIEKVGKESFLVRRYNEKNARKRHNKTGRYSVD